MTGRRSATGVVADRLGRGYPSPVSIPSDARRGFLGVAKKFLLESPKPPAPAEFEPPRLTFAALEKIPMSRSRERILANLEEMYSEAFKRAKASEDEAQMAQLDFAYRREQLYFEILLDVRDATERRA
jgi:hypothetical protein